MYLIKKKILGVEIFKNIKCEIKPFKGENNKFHYVYRVYVPFTKMEYIGVRTHFNWKKDKYIGSSSHLFYKQDLIKSEQIEFEILSFHETRFEAEIKENTLVNIEYVLRKDTYNLKSPTIGLNQCNIVFVKCLESGKKGSITSNDYSTLKNKYVHILCKPVYQFTRNGEFVKKHESSEIASSTLKTSKNIITQCAKGNTPHAGGYLWLYEDNLSELDNRIKVLKNVKTNYYRKVYQYDLKGNLIKIHDTLKSAVDKYSNNSIGKCCRGDSKYRHVCGFIWLYEDKLHELKERISQIKNKNLSGKNKKVYQFDLKGNLLNEYKSYQDAKLKTGLDSGISKSCIGEYKKAYGYIWLYDMSELPKRISDIS